MRCSSVPMPSRSRPGAPWYCIAATSEGGFWFGLARRSSPGPRGSGPEPPAALLAVASDHEWSAAERLKRNHGVGERACCGDCVADETKRSEGPAAQWPTAPPPIPSSPSRARACAGHRRRQSGSARSNRCSRDQRVIPAAHRTCSRRGCGSRGRLRRSPHRCAHSELRRPLRAKRFVGLAESGRVMSDAWIALQIRRAGKVQVRLPVQGVLGDLERERGNRARASRRAPRPSPQGAGGSTTWLYKPIRYASSAVRTSPGHQDLGRTSEADDAGKQPGAPCRRTERPTR